MLCFDLDLSKVKVEEECGFIWVSMNDNIVSVREYLGEVAEHLDLYEINKMNVFVMLSQIGQQIGKLDLSPFMRLITFHLSIPKHKE